MNPYIKSKYNKSINKKQDGGYDGTESVPIKATFADKMKQQQQYGSPQLQQGNLPANIENRTRGRNLRGDDIVSTVDDDISSKYVVTPNKTINTNVGNNQSNNVVIDGSGVRGDNKSATARTAFEKSANERYNQNNPIAGYKGLTTNQSDVDYNDPMFRGKNTRNSDGSETTPMIVTTTTKKLDAPTNVNTTSSNIQLGGDKQGNVLTPKSENGKGGNMNIQLDFQERGHGDANGKITDDFYNKLDPKTANLLKKAGGASQLITSNQAVSDPELQEAINKAVAVHGQARISSTALKSSLDSSAQRNETMKYLQQNNTAFRELSKGEQARLFQSGNESELNRMFGQSIIEFNNNRAKQGTEVNRRSSYTASGNTTDNTMTKDKTTDNTTPGIESRINTQQGDRLKLKGENPPYGNNTPPKENVRPEPKPRPRIGTGKSTSSNRTSTSTSRTTNPGINKSNPGKTRDIKMGTQNQSSAPATNTGTNNQHNMKVEGKGNEIESKTKKFVPNKQMGGYSNHYNSDYGQYTQSNTSANPQLGSVDYYKQVMQKGGRVSRFEQLNSEMNKVNEDKPKYQTGQKIKYKMGGEIKEGVVKSYDKDNKKLELY